jgi:hypothetical protein
MESAEDVLRRLRDVRATLSVTIAEVDDLMRVVAAAPWPAQGDVATACENWIRGVGWDETFTRTMVDDEFDKLERRLHMTPPRGERDRLVQLWLAEHARRFPAAA